MTTNHTYIYLPGVGVTLLAYECKLACQIWSAGLSGLNDFSTIMPAMKYHKDFPGICSDMCRANVRLMYD